MQVDDMAITPAEIEEFQRMLEKAELKDLTIECEPKRIIQTFRIAKVTGENTNKETSTLRVWDITSDIYLLVCLTSGLDLDDEPVEILGFACNIFKTDELAYCAKRSKYFLLIDKLSETEYEIVCAMLKLNRNLFNTRLRELEREFSSDEQRIVSKLIYDFSFMRIFKTEEFKRSCYAQKHIEKYGYSDLEIKFKPYLSDTDSDNDSDSDTDTTNVIEFDSLKRFAAKMNSRVEKKINSLLPSVTINGCSWLASKRLNSFFVANLPLAVNSSMETTTEVMEAICEAIKGIKDKSETFESTFNKPFEPKYECKGFYGPSILYFPYLSTDFLEDLSEDDEEARLSALETMENNKAYDVLDMLGMINKDIIIFLVSSSLEDDNRYLLVMNQTDRKDYLVLDL